MNENQLLESKELREKLKERVQVLNKVKGLLLMSNTELATTEQVANYYEVGIEAINSLVKDNRDEVSADGYKVLTGIELKSFKDLCDIKSRARQISVFPLRAILRIGMLLRDSRVAKEVRTQLLNTMEHTTDEAKVFEIDEEKQLAMNVMFAKNDIDRAIAINELLKYQDKYKERMIEQLKPQLTIAKTFTGADDVLYDVNKFSKVINIQGLGRNKLFEWLREKKMLRSNNEPYQAYMNYFKVILTENNGYINSKTVIKPQGIEFIVKNLIEDGKLITKTVQEILSELNNAKVSVA